MRVRSNHVVHAVGCIALPGGCGALTAANSYASGSSTSDALKAGARGQVGAFVGQQVAGFTGAKSAAFTLPNIIGNGLGGGVNAHINGGSFRDGFIGAAFGAAFKPLNYKVWDTGAAFQFHRVVTAGFIGGVGSYISGGKFGYGAFTGAFGQYWNGEQALNRARVNAVRQELMKNNALTTEKAIDGLYSYTNYSGLAATGFLMTGNLPAYGIINLTSMGAGIFGMTLDMFYGESFSEASAAGTANGVAIDRLQNIVTPMMPTQYRVPTNVALDSYSSVTRFLLNEAASNE